MWKPQGIYSRYLLHQPTILLGEYALEGLLQYPGTRFLVVYGSALDQEREHRLRTVFKKQSVKFVKKSWRGEPVLDEMRETLSQIEEYKPDVLIAIGGGSVIDGTKLCRLFYEFPYYQDGDRLDQLYFKTSFIAIPTTIGSGAEISSAAVYNDSDNLGKRMVVSYNFLPSVVVFDSGFIQESSKELLYLSSLDMMAHLVEGYVSQINNELVDLFAETGLRIIYEELNSEKIDYVRLQYACYLGGMVQNHCLVGAAHGIAHQLTNDGFSHAEAVGILLTPVIKANMTNRDIEKKYEILFEKCGLYNIHDGLEFIEGIRKKVILNTREKELKEKLSGYIDQEEFVGRVVSDKGAKGNPINIDREYLKTVVEKI